MLARKEIPQTAATLKRDELLSGMDIGEQHASGTPKNANKRRFSDEQIKFLECMFETESRPESQIKHQLAYELGLEPRQISIWFQNRRARVKSKHVQNEYNKLKSSHDALASSFDSLKRENQLLLVQLQKLKNIYAKQHESRSLKLDQTQSNNKNQRLQNRAPDYKIKSKENPGQGHLLEGYSYSSKEGTISSSHDSEKSGKETNIFNFNQTQRTDGSMTSMDWHSFESNSFLDESSCSSQWWELLS